MKKKFKLNRLFVSLMILGCTFGFTACSDDDDDNTPTPPSEKEVYGEYAGKVQISPVTTQTANEEQTGTDIIASVKNDTVHFNNFPIKDLVTAIVGDEDANNIIEAIGKVNYKIGYEATMNTTKDSIFITLDPKPLKITVPGETEEDNLIVEVTVIASNKGNYALKSKELKFNFIAKKVTVSGQDFPNFPTSNFNFKMTKK